ARLGRLDDALVIVHSDHGDMDFLLRPRVKGEGTEFAVDAGARTYQPLDRTYDDNDAAVANLNDGDSRTWRSMAVEVFSSGLLLVKFPHAKTYAEDHRPVELLDVAPTVLAHFGAKTSRPLAGVRLDRAPEVRSSVFFVHNRTFAGGFAKYLLTDHGWQFTSETIPFSNER